MTVAADRYYRCSGAVPFGGTVLMLGAGLVAAGVLAFVYALINVHNPFIYITFLATLGFGAGVGAAVQFGSRKGNVRNPLFCSLVGLGLGGVALLLTWIWYVWMITKYEVFITDPAEMWNVVRVLGELGVWSIRGLKPTGWFLYSFWIVEAGVIAVGAALIAAGNDVPFCEYCQRWTEATGEPAALPLATSAQFKEDLEAERYGVLDELRKGTADPDNCLQPKIYACSNCANSNYLTIAHVTVGVDKKGNTETKSVDVVKHLWIPPELAEWLGQPAAEAVAVEAVSGDETSAQAAVEPGY